MAPYLDDMTSSEAMSRMQPADGPSAGGDDLDDLFDYDAGIDESAFRAPSPPRTTKAKGDALGIDEAVEVIKKIRAPKPKLDDTRLLSNAGISKLQQRAKSLKLKGKGHEYSDAARLLQMYQLWLDDLFPKAKFLDGLAMIEKIGHTRRIQSARMGWINEGKPKDIVEEQEIFGQASGVENGEKQDTLPSRIAPIFENSTTRAETPSMPEDPMDDIYNVTPRAKEANVAPTTSIFGPGKMIQPDELEDDLDALLAEAEMEGTGSASAVVNKTTTAVLEPDFDDEMEAMAEMEGMW